MSENIAQEQKLIFAGNLKYHMNRLGITQDDIVRSLGYSSSTVSDWCNAKKYPRIKRMQELADYLKVSISELRDPPSSWKNTITIVPPGFEPLPRTVRIPLIGSIACGEPITAEENVEDYVDAPAEGRPDFALHCKGDSMIDAGIEDGDIVYIRKVPEVRNGEIAAVRIGDEATLKYVYWDDGALTLVPANKRMPPRTYTGEALEDVHIEGKAVGFTHWFK